MPAVFILLHFNSNTTHWNRTNTRAINCINYGGRDLQHYDILYFVVSVDMAKYSLVAGLHGAQTYATPCASRTDQNVFNDEAVFLFFWGPQISLGPHITLTSCKLKFSMVSMPFRIETL